MIVRVFMYPYIVCVCVYVNGRTGVYVSINCVYVSINPCARVHVFYKSMLTALATQAYTKNNIYRHKHTHTHTHTHTHKRILCVRHQFVFCFTKTTARDESQFYSIRRYACMCIRMMCARVREYCVHIFSFHMHVYACVCICACECCTFTWVTRHVPHCHTLTRRYAHTQTLRWL